MELPVDRRDSVGRVVKGEEMVANGCPLKDFAQAFLKLDAWCESMEGLRMGRNACFFGKAFFSKESFSAEEGRKDINTRFFCRRQKRNLSLVKVSFVERKVLGGEKKEKNEYKNEK